MTSDHTSLNTVALNHFHQERHARLVPFAGYNMPLQYESGILQEHLHVREKAGLFDVSHMGVIHVDGPESTQVLETLIPADLKELSLGKVAYGLLLNDYGGIVDDLMITRLENGFLLVVNAGKKHEDLAYLKNNLPSTIQITPVFDRVILALQGPKAFSVLQEIFPDVQELTFMTANNYAFQKDFVWISRSGYTGEDGFELILPPSCAEDLASLLLENQDVRLIGLGARDSLRLEAGMCLYGHDLTEETTPIQASLTWAIGKRRRQEGGFKGSALILSELENGPARKRIALKLNDRVIAREGANIHLKDGTCVGQITSGVHSPTLGIPIAMGYVDTLYLDADLFVDVRGQLRPATLCKLPFVPHNYVRG